MERIHVRDGGDVPSCLEHIKLSARLPLRRRVKTPNGNTPATGVGIGGIGAASNRFRRRATGIVRTFVVATATLAILVVCFSIYQFSQLDPETEAQLKKPEDALRTTATDRDAAAPNSAETPVVALGPDGNIGPGETISYTLYPSEGTRATLEITVKGWTPVAGSSNEFLLTQPDIRTLTSDDHAVRVTADNGVLVAQRKTGGGLDPQSGKLSGNVVIIYDRLSQQERAGAPPERQDPPDPADLVRMEMDEIAFDLEYSKVIIPGSLHLAARDVDFVTGNVEIRFNEAEDRIDSMRIGGGGRIELHGSGDALGFSLPSPGGGGAHPLTLVEWISASIQSRLEIPPDAPESSDAPPEDAAVVQAPSDGVPVFRRETDENEAPGPPIRYFARFKGEVDAEQYAGDQRVARLESDILEIVRDFSDKDNVLASSQAPAVPTDTKAKPESERIVLAWKSLLSVEVCTPDDPRCEGDARSRISASGSPARLTHPQGEALCRRLTFDPDGGEVWLEGTEAEPLIVRDADDGVIKGMSLHSRRIEDAMSIRVVGPGSVERARSGDASDVDGRFMIDFSDRLELNGRFVTRPRFNYLGGISSRERRILDQARFFGHVAMRQGEMNLDADSVEIDFKTDHELRGAGQSIERVVGEGNVLVKLGGDRVTCGKIDLALTTDAEGRTVPLTAVATGEVLADQGERSIRARDRLVVDFEMIRRPAPPFDAVKAHAAAVAAGADVNTIDWEARRREHESKVHREIAIRRMQAFRDVTVVDPVQALDLSAHRLDCTIVNGREIETALVEGLEGRPATVKLDDFTVTGRQIKLHVPDQWAEVPGAGRMTFLSRKDLDGRKTVEPVPIAVTWDDWMRYQGRENRSVFSGSVHATSRDTTTFDCDRLEVHFDDVVPNDSGGQRRDWWIFQEIVDRATSKRGGAARTTDRPRFRKEPAKILAQGNAIALTSELDPETGAVLSRARISGPKLSVNLRSEVSRMLIEGAGNLLIEDNRPIEPSAHASTNGGGGLFGVEDDSGPSNTLIVWRKSMWYDFAINQTRFEGSVRLKYFSGTELTRIRGTPGDSGSDMPRGRSTFLDCDVLTVDFQDPQGGAKRDQPRRLGRLSADRLAQFVATGSVVLQDPVEGLSLTAARVEYMRDRHLLAIYGTPQRNAYIVTQKPGHLPSQVTVEHLFYNLVSGELELSQPKFRTR